MKNAHGGSCRRVPDTQCHNVSTLPQLPAGRRSRDFVRPTARLTLARLSKRFGILSRPVHGTLQNPAMLIHLAQLALGVTLVFTMYQQLIHNQSAACAYAERIFRDRRMHHKPPLIQALMVLIAYACDQLNANSCTNGNLSRFPGTRHPCAQQGRTHCARRPDSAGGAGQRVQNKTAGKEPAVSHLQPGSGV